jgi:transcriptional regulator with XRE-family HTH domain
MSFPEKLKALRIKHKLTQEELGEKLCLSRTNISYYEQGKFEPDINTIIAISDLFKISIDELLK